MHSIRYDIRLLLLAVLVCAGCQGSTVYVGPAGESYFDHASGGADFDSTVERVWRRADTDGMHRLAADDALRAADPKTDVDACLAMPVRHSFVWLSDVQLRDEAIGLYEDRRNGELTRPALGFERVWTQGAYDWASYLAMVEAANSLARSAGLGFVVHSGDAVDAGMLGELYQFVRLSDLLAVPWLNAVGNHDRAIFGNAEREFVVDTTAIDRFEPVGGRDAFVTMHGTKPRGRPAVRAMVERLGRLRPTAPMASTLPDGHPVTASRCHGFDLGAARADRRPCADHPGYYAFDVDGQMPVRFIVLDTSREPYAGLGAGVDEAQRAWLARTLSPDHLNMVVGHHEAESLPDEVRELLGGLGDSQVVYLSGHRHSHRLTRHDDGAHGFWDMANGSIINYPQLGRLVRIRGRDGRGCVVSRALWSARSGFDPASRPPQDSIVDRALVDCRRIAPDEVSLGRAARCAHLGALAEYRGDADKPWDARTDSGWRDANVVLEVGTGK